MITRAIFSGDQIRPRTRPVSRAVFRFTRPALLLSVLSLSVQLLLTTCSSVAADESESPTAGASSSATIKSLSVTPVLPNDENGAVPLISRDERRQLHATAEMHNGRLIDYTRNVTWTVSPAGLAEIDQSGLLIPRQNGSGEILARTQLGVEARRPLQITGMDGSQAISFRHQIVPIFTKLNCNGGGCHGKASGQNGFRLSLLGFYPEDDYEFLVYESR
ncbi:S-layer protein, partial [bacterium]|nr:S-layer protein [bacterium]